MTLIICKRIDCMYIFQRVDKDYQCGRIYIGIGQDKKCDTYMQMPEQTVEADAQICPNCNKPILGNPIFCIWCAEEKNHTD